MTSKASRKRRTDRARLGQKAAARDWRDYKHELALRPASDDNRRKTDPVAWFARWVPWIGLFLLGIGIIIYNLKGGWDGFK